MSHSRGCAILFSGRNLEEIWLLKLIGLDPWIQGFLQDTKRGVILSMRREGELVLVLSFNDQGRSESENACCIIGTLNLVLNS